MIKILKKILVALIISVLVFPHASIALAAKPTPSSSFTLIDSLLKAKKPSTEPKPTIWNGNGTIDGQGLCEDLSYDENAPAGVQSWLFILTSPAADAPYKLTTEFDPSWQDPDSPIIGERKGNGSVHFIVETEIGAQLVKASAEFGTSNSVLTVSHCTHSVKPLDVEKTAETSYTRTWDWDIEKTGDKEALGDMEEGETKTVSYEIVVGATKNDSDHLISGDITITNPADNPPAMIASIEDYLDGPESVTIDCPDITEYPHELAPEGEIVCTYEFETDEKMYELNTVKVDAVIGGLDLQSVATDDVEWADEPTVETDECVTLSDTNSLFGEKYNNVDEEVKVCATDLEENGSKSFTYDVIFGEDVELICGENKYSNTARVLSLRLDEEDEPIMLDEDQWTVTYTYNCPIAMCGYSQGYWFSKPGVVWPVDVSLGGEEYAQLESVDIWDLTGSSSARRGFQQYSTMFLNKELQGWTDFPADLIVPMATINDYFDFNTPPKYDGNNITGNNATVNSAADAISTWIGENHCADDDFVGQ